MNLPITELLEQCLNTTPNQLPPICKIQDKLYIDCEYMGVPIKLDDKDLVNIVASYLEKVNLIHDKKIKFLESIKRPTL